MASFSGNSFSERPSGALFVVWNREVEMSVRHVPGGNVNVIQSGGRGADRVSIPIKCSSAELSALLGVVGNSASLVYSYGTRTATLERITDVSEIRASGTYFATLHFIGQ